MEYGYTLIFQRVYQITPAINMELIRSVLMPARVQEEKHMENVAIGYISEGIV